MYGYEELASYTSRDLWFNDCLLGLRFYETKDADKVILAHEARIKELEKQLEDVQNTMATENVDLGMENFKLKERVKELELQIPKWVSVKDVNNRPNEIGDYVLVCDYVNRTRGTAIYQNGKFTLTTCGIAELNITHWMPLPPTTEESSAIEKEK